MSNEAGPSRPRRLNRSRDKTTQALSPSPTAATSQAIAKPKPRPQPVEAFANPDKGEETTVHEVYELIAPHFSQTRHKPWPLITRFLNDLPPGSVGLDSGAGNGKYLPTAAEAGHTMIALDRSIGLLEIARNQRGAGDVVRGDLGATCWRPGVFDFVISVAAIHHLSTPERRRQAVQAILPCLRLNAKPPYARFFIYVWAYEQGPLSKRAMGSLSSTSTTSNGEGIGVGVGVGEPIQDVLVPWVVKAKEGEQEDTVHHRYYHLFVKDELSGLVREAAEVEGYQAIDVTGEQGQGREQGLGRWMRFRGEGWEADNWWIEVEVGQGQYVPEPKPVMVENEASRA